MIKEAIIKLTEQKSLSSEEARVVFEEIFNRKATSSQIAAFLVALKMKGENEDEISAAAKVIRERAKKLNLKESFFGIKRQIAPIIDTCGTGGGGINKFNISTCVSFIVSAANIKVAKHGNRGMSSTCGSADVLEALGIKIDIPPSIMEKAIKEIGIGFLYAPLYHPALKEVAKIRKEMGIRTIFNILGPLCNPALVTHQLLGVYKKELVPIIAKVLRSLGLKRAFVVHSKDLKDEVSLGSITFVSFLNNRQIKNFYLKPSDFGLKKVKLKDLEAKDAKDSAQIILDILNGKKGAPRNTVLANASCCFYLLGKVNNLKEGVKFAAKLIDEGVVKKKFLEFKNFIRKNVQS
jgi:anthranilate phosphoribosyltransferase